MWGKLVPWLCLWDGGRSGQTEGWRTDITQDCLPSLSLWWPCCPAAVNSAIWTSTKLHVGLWVLRNIGLLQDTWIFKPVLIQKNVFIIFLFWEVGWNGFFPSGFFPYQNPGHTYSVGMWWARIMYHFRPNLTSPHLSTNSPSPCLHTLSRWKKVIKKTFSFGTVLNFVSGSRHCSPRAERRTPQSAHAMRLCEKHKASVEKGF